jgi:hypothetical protein
MEEKSKILMKRSLMMLMTIGLSELLRWMKSKELK